MYKLSTNLPNLQIMSNCYHRYRHCIRIQHDFSQFSGTSGSKTFPPKTNQEALYTNNTRINNQSKPEKPISIKQLEREQRELTQCHCKNSPIPNPSRILFDHKTITSELEAFAREWGVRFRHSACTRVPKPTELDA